MVVIPARQATKAGGPIRHAFAIVDFITQSGTKKLATERAANLIMFLRISRCLSS
jgi:hypothetical protein